MAYINPRANQRAQPYNPSMGRNDPLNPNVHPGVIPPRMQVVPSTQQTQAPGVSNLQVTRNMLIQHGYNVDPTGPATDRLTKALMHFKKTSGKGVDLWNMQNPTQTQMHQSQEAAGRAPGHPGSNAVTVAPDHPLAQAHQTAFHGTRTRSTTAPATTVPDTTAATIAADTPATTDTSGALPLDLQKLLAKYSKTLNPANINLQQPTLDPTQYASQQANMEYNPVISGLQDQIGQLIGSAKGTTDNIAKYYAPAQAQAQAALTQGNLAAQQNMQNQQGLGDKTATSLGLTGAEAGGVQGSAKAGSDYASALAAIMAQQNAQQQTNVDTNMADAQTAASSANTNSIANLRSQLLGQQQAKGQAQSKYQTDAQALRQQEQTNYINNEGTLLNQKTTAALALPQIASAYQGLTKNQQSLAVTGQQATQSAQAAADAHAGNLQNFTINGQRATIAQKESDARIQNLLHPQTSSGTRTATQTPWNAVEPGNKIQLANQLHKMFHTAKGPNSAYAGMLDYVKNQVGYSGPKIAAYVKSVIDQNWAKNNPNMVYDPKTKSYINKKTGAKLG